jgi:protein-S-isoprenylcysteine O-methyltransferase Ste14
MRTLSVAAFGCMVAGIVWLVFRSEVFAHSVPAIAVQALAVLLMILARMAFGMRSFHAAANPTEGGLVTTGPYHWMRHPIYAAILYFTWATVIDHHTRGAVASGLLVTLGAAVRMYFEEQLLVGMYPDYRDYAARTARVVPFLF